MSVVRSNEKRTFCSSCVSRSCFSSRSLGSSCMKSGWSMSDWRDLISGMAANASSVSLEKEEISVCTNSWMTSGSFFISITVWEHRGSFHSSRMICTMYCRYCVDSIPTLSTSLNCRTRRCSSSETSALLLSSDSEACITCRESRRLLDRSGTYSSEMVWREGQRGRYFRHVGAHVHVEETPDLGRLVAEAADQQAENRVHVGRDEDRVRERDPTTHESLRNQRLESFQNCQHVFDDKNRHVFHDVSPVSMPRAAPLSRTAFQTRSTANSPTHTP